MSLANTYVQAYGQLKEFLEKIQEGQAPDHFTQRHLKDLGFTSSSHRAFIPLLKAIGFLTPEGIPTPRYHEFRSKAQAPKVMAEALRDAYSDLFTIKERPTKSDTDLIKGKFKSAHNVSDRVAELMTKTFYSLLELADLRASDRPKAKQEPAEERPAHEEPAENSQLLPPTLHYNIQIHLPATKDVEVFNAIFKSLKEHLIE